MDVHGEDGVTVHHESYAELFHRAEEESKARGLIQGPGPCVHIPPDAGFALHALPTIGRAVNSYPYKYEDIRVQCAAIHLTLYDDPRWDAPCVLTVGDVEVDGKRAYDASYEGLDEELRGLHRNSTTISPCHVWLTFPDMHIVDVTFFIYHYYDRVPSPFTWSEYLICSDHRSSFAAELPLRYVPMLIGRDAVVPLVV